MAEGDALFFDDDLVQERALEVAGTQHPDCSLNVAFPLDPDAFFVPDAPEGVESETAA